MLPPDRDFFRLHAGSRPAARVRRLRRCFSRVSDHRTAADATSRFAAEQGVTDMMKATTIVLATAAAVSLAAFAGCKGSDNPGGASARYTPNSQATRDAPKPPATAANSMADAGATPQAGGAMPGTAAGARVDDATITAKVKTALLAQTSVDVTKIDVSTSAGKVTLKGEAPKSQIERVVEVARAVEGVQEVVNQVRPSGAA
jgi:hyperosmotically inducible protein